MKFLTNTGEGSEIPSNANATTPKLMSPSDYRDKMTHGVSNRRYTAQR